LGLLGGLGGLCWLLGGGLWSSSLWGGSLWGGSLWGGSLWSGSLWSGSLWSSGSLWGGSLWSSSGGGRGGSFFFLGDSGLSSGRDETSSLEFFFSSLGNKFGVSLDLFDCAFTSFDFESLHLALVGESSWGNKSLDFWGSGACFLSLASFLERDLLADDILTDIVLFGEGEQLSDLACSLWSESVGTSLLCLGEVWDLLFSLLSDDEVDKNDFVGDDASTDRFALS